jgi:quinol monooxygenase YgiN
MLPRILFIVVLYGFVVPSVQADDYKQPDAAMQDLGKNLLANLKATPGCLGVETAKTDSGKHMIFAFFENKKAVLAWYNSPTHQKLLTMLNPNRSKKHIPMKGVPDDVPLMAVASITPSDKPEPGKMPFSQIAIEIYTPMTRGLNIGGGFAPEAFRKLHKQEAKPTPEK